MENLETDVAVLHCGDRDGKLFQNDNQKKSFFLCILGMEALQVYNGCDPDDNDKVNDIIRKLYCTFWGK